MYFQDILHNNKDYGNENRVVLVLGTRDNGITFSSEEVVDIFQELDDRKVKGLTIVGDEPLSPSNLNLLTELCKACKECAPAKSIHCYTGLSLDKIKDLEIMKYIDVIK